MCTKFPQRWVVCALCSSAIGIIAYKNICLLEMFTLVQKISSKHVNPNFSESVCLPIVPIRIWLPRKKKELPFIVPKVYLNNNLVKISKDIYIVGSVFAQIPSGMLADVGTSRSLIGATILLDTILCFCFPIILKSSPTIYLVVCFVNGVLEGVVVPCSASLASRWLPFSECNTFMAIIVIGWFVGDGFGQLIFQLYYIHSPRWEIISYSSGCLLVIWLLCWYFCGYNSPLDSPLVSPKELQYISPPPRMRKIAKLFRIPWKNILTSAPVWSLLAMHCGFQWLMYAALEWAVMFYQEIGFYELGRLAGVSSVAGLSTLPSAVLGGVMSDWIVKNGVLSKTVNNKVWCVIGVTIPAALLTLIHLFGNDWMMFTGLYVTVVYFLGFASGPTFANPITLSPRYAGLILGIINGVRKLLVIFSGKILSSFTSTNCSSSSHGGVMFWSVFAVIVVLSIIYLYFGSGDQQPWDGTRKRRTTGIRHDTTSTLTQTSGDNDHQSSSRSSEIVESSITNRGRYWFST